MNKKADEQTPGCPQCGRPLQRNRTTCIYCDHKLSDAEIAEIAGILDDETVDRRLKEAEAMLEGTLPKTLSGRGKLIAKIVVTILCFFNSLWAP